jgi:predicted Rossmann fold nucleotide-binding protein DprA/Smf involved in DNA uptake
MAEFNWESAYKGQEQLPAVVQLFGREQEVYEMLSAEPVHFDQLCQKTGMDAGEMSGTLTMLELAGIITRHHGDWYSKDGRSFINSAADNS